MISPIEEIEISAFKKRYQAQDYKVLKIKIPVDLERCLNILDEILANYELVGKDQYTTTYKGIGLHYSNEEDPFYDCIDRIAHIDVNENFTAKRNRSLFAKHNEIGKKFIFLEEQFDFLKLTRGRILQAMPGFKMGAHCDGSYMCNLHFPLRSAPGAYIVVNDEKFYLEPGGCYLLNAELPHYAVNESDQIRTHLIYTISPICFKSLTESDLLIFDKYFKFLIKNFIIPLVPWVKLEK